MEIIIGRNGTQKTRITDPTVSRQHCKVTTNPDGTYTVENLSATGTMIDGREIIKATARAESRIQLGPTFSAILSDLIGTIAESPKDTSKQPSTNPSATSKQEKTYNIAHLRRVWDDYNETNIATADQQRKINLTRTGFGIFTMCAMPTIFMFGPIGYALTGLGIIGNIYSFVGMKNAETAQDRQKRQDEFDDAWVCPNPDCHHSLPAKNYRRLVNDFKTCPYCKCRYVEK